MPHSHLSNQATLPELRVLSIENLSFTEDTNAKQEKCTFVYKNTTTSQYTISVSRAIRSSRSLYKVWLIISTGDLLDNWTAWVQKILLFFSSINSFDNVSALFNNLISDVDRGRERGQVPKFGVKWTLTSLPPPEILLLMCIYVYSICDIML